MTLDLAGFSDHLFNITFDAEVITDHLWSMSHRLRKNALKALVQSRSVSILNVVIEKGLDIIVEGEDFSFLGSAAAAGHEDTAQRLLAHGANGALAIHDLLHTNIPIPHVRFKDLLKLLVDHSRPAPGYLHRDGLLAVIQSRKAMSLYPEAADILIEKRILDQVRLGGYQRREWLPYSYLFQSIVYDLPHVVDLLLQY